MTTNGVYTSQVAKSSTKHPPCPYPAKTPQALEWALGRMYREVQFNLRSHLTEWRQGWNGGTWWGKWEPMTTRAAAHIRDDIRIYHNLTFGQVAFDDCLESILYEHESDPLLDYFRSLDEPVGRNILPGVLQTCMKVDKRYEDLARWASVNMFLGVVCRTFTPGTKLDEICILVGPGGIGKSTFPAMAVPQHIPGLYGSGLDLSGTPLRMVEAIQGKAVCEVSEMVGAGDADLARIKDFISRTDDAAVRLSYRHNPEPLPRRCVIMGTADRDRFLPPDKNHRRFVPIMLTKGHASKVRRYMDKNRERLWSEAVAMYHKGKTAHLPEALKGKAEWAVGRAQWEKVV